MSRQPRLDAVPTAGQPGQVTRCAPASTQSGPATGRAARRRCRSVAPVGSAVLDTLDATAVRRWCAAGLAALRRHQGEIDELNVYPVPDGDTGTNLVLTLTSAAAGAGDAAWAARPDDGDTAHGHALRLMARGALLGARGNSGVILSQLLRGLADALGAGADGARPGAGRRAARRAAEAAYAGGGRAGRGHRAHRGAPRPPRRADAGRHRRPGARWSGRPPRAAAEALARTPEQLPVLARAGVVDAGGRGLVPAARRAGRGGHRARRPRPGRRRLPARSAAADRRPGDRLRPSTRTRCSSCSTPPTARWPAARRAGRAGRLAGGGRRRRVSRRPRHLERARARQRRRARPSRPASAPAGRTGSR